MKVVFDTNIIISGLYSKRGASYQLLKAALSGKLPYAISPLIALEYEGKIHQKIEAGFLKISIRDCARILNALFAMASIVWEPLLIRPVLTDPADDKILECAISGGCTHIVTFDKKHFPLAILAQYGIKVMNAGEFLKIWRDKV
jgi:putative PIN family toxin of toxin-antitoxin system